MSTVGGTVPPDPAARIEALGETLRDVLSNIRPQGHPSWKVNTCLVTNEQLTRWWATLGVAPRGHACDVSER
ncbi:hypothetical protein ACWDU8_05335 [Streptomyces sp. NPDC003388]|uniref:hypothetical protein n=1 Tax=Streptomyces sp. ATE26 TaxID=2954237 RepID=UPI002482C1B7|nr:hypothetical protein [Streptomyces sp. ATE26]MDI1453140.1 hypothetical protein [Streptomyces sp. ATE26]